MLFINYSKNLNSKMHQKTIVSAGNKSGNAKKALILLHGRGSSAEDILSITQHLDVIGYALYAPQATNNSWYPQSFLMPPAQNEPWLSSALMIINNLVEDIKNGGIKSEDIYLLGFSQGACLTLEFAARNATKYGGVIAFTGGLIGDKIYKENYNGNFKSTPIFIGTSNPDMHVPVERVHASSIVLQNMGALVTEKIYDNMGHTINQDEIEQVNKLIFNTTNF